MLQSLNRKQVAQPLAQQVELRRVQKLLLTIIHEQRTQTLQYFQNVVQSHLVAEG